MSRPAVVEDAFARAKAELADLPPNLRFWTEHHLIPPREITVWCDPDRKKSTKVGLLTDHVGEEDSSSRIVFDPEAKLFGLEMTLDHGTEWYMGPQSESFAATVRSM